MLVPEPIDEKAETKEKAIFIDRKTYTWERVGHTVPISGGTRRFLHQVWGYVKPVDRWPL